MYTFSDIFKKHVNNPKNVGEINNPDGAGRSESDCGDYASCNISVKDNRITDIKFITVGCGVTEASASIISETLMNQNLDKAKSITDFSVSESLGGLPEEKLHCVNLCTNALKNAISNYESKK